MSANTRTRAQRALDLEKLSELNLAGKSHAYMAQELGLSRRLVTFEINKLDKIYQSTLENAHVGKARELAKINRLEAIYNTAWERSLQEKTSTTSEKTDETGGDNGKVRNKAAVKKEGRDGNPIFLAGIQWCIEQRCRIFGHFAPKRITLETLSAVLENLPADLAVEVRAIIIGDDRPPGLADLQAPDDPEAGGEPIPS